MSEALEPPELGQHSRAVLGDYGLGGDEIDALVSAGVVGEHETPSAAVSRAS